MVWMICVGAVGGLGLAALLWMHDAPPGSTARGNSRSVRGGTSIGWRTIGWMVTPAFVVGLVTRWPVAAILAGAAGAFIPHLFGVTAASKAIESTEAVAAWAEMLRDCLAGSAGLGQAIVTSAPIAPRAIRDAVVTLASRVEAGVPLGLALRQFADDAEGPGADLVVAALVLATEQRAQKLGDLLGALAVASREEVSMRLRIEASRAQVRTGVRVVAGFSVGFAVFLMLVARSYLAPFGSAGGQAVLAGVGCLYAAGLVLMLRMARPKPQPRLLFAGAESR